MKPNYVRRPTRASYSESCNVPPAQTLPLSYRVAQVRDIECLFDCLPVCANKNLRSFIADVFDKALLEAYATPTKGACGLDRERAGHSLLDWSLEAAEQARRYPALHAWERDVAAAAALVAPCGLAGYLKDRPCLGPLLSLSREAREEITARRVVILHAPLRSLCSREAEIGRTLGAVLDVMNDDEIERHQVARITAAIGCMAVL